MDIAERSVDKVRFYILKAPKQLWDEYDVNAKNLAFQKWIARKAKYGIGSDYVSKSALVASKNIFKVMTDFTVSFPKKMEHVVVNGSVERSIVAKRKEFTRMLRPREKLVYNFDEDPGDDERLGPLSWYYFIGYTWGSMYDLFQPSDDY